MSPVRSSLRQAIWVVLLTAAISNGASQALAQEDRNLVVQKLIYTKVRNLLTLGEDRPDSLFVLLNPGIPLDPNWDLTKLADQQKISRLLGRSLKPSWLYRPASLTVDEIYSEVLGHHNTGRAKLTPVQLKDLEAKRDEAKNVLYKDNAGTHTKLYDQYLDLKDKYNQALLQLQYERQKAEAAGTALDPKYQAAVDALYNDWTGQKGQKDVVEGAEDIYRQINGILNPAAWWTELTSQYNANTPIGPQGRFARLLLDDDYKTLFGDTGWMDLKVSDADVLTTTFHEHTSLSVGGSAGWGLWAVHVGGEFQEDKGHSLSDAKSFDIQFQVRQTGITYPWMNSDVFYNHGWRWAPGWGGTRLSDAGNIPSSYPKGRLTLLPTTLVFSRKVTATGNWNTSEVTTYSSLVTSNASVGWGPFSIGGSYSKSTESGTAHGQVTSNEIKAPDVQIIGMFCDVLPRSPYPDTDLDWTPPLTAKDIDGGGDAFALMAQLEHLQQTYKHFTTASAKMLAQPK